MSNQILSNFRNGFSKMTCNKCINGWIEIEGQSNPCDCLKQRQKEQVWRDAGIPYIYWPLEISMIDLKQGELESRTKNKEAVTIFSNFKKTLSQRLESNEGLFIYGSHGNGKTLCACDIAKFASLERKENGKQYKVVFVTFKGLISIILGSRSFDPLFVGMEQEEIKSYYEKFCIVWGQADLRVIDDIGKEPTTKSGNESAILDEFVRSTLYGEKKSIIVTSNIKPTDIKDNYNSNIDSLLSRKILQVELTAEDYFKERSEDLRKELLNGKCLSS